MKPFRITWRHEIYIDAESREDAQAKWEAIELGSLTAEEILNPSVQSHDFVELVSFEGEDDPIDDQYYHRPLKEFLEDMLDKFPDDPQEDVREELKICEKCPSKDNCWSCGQRPHEWWIEPKRHEHPENSSSG